MENERRIATQRNSDTHADCLTFGELMKFMRFCICNILFKLQIQNKSSAMMRRTASYCHNTYHHVEADSPELRFGRLYVAMIFG